MIWKIISRPHPSPVTYMYQLKEQAVPAISVLKGYVHPVQVDQVHHADNSRRTRSEGCPPAAETVIYISMVRLEALHLIHIKSDWIRMMAGLASREAVSCDSNKSYVFIIDWFGS